MKRILLATVALLALSSQVFAQTPTPAPVPGVVSVPPSTKTMAIVVTEPMFATVATGEDLSSTLIGLDVYNNADKKIGTVKDIAMNDGRVHAYIIGVGGFLGMGDHYVAVTPKAIKITYRASDKSWHAVMDTDVAALKAAPEYKYQS